MPVTWDTKEKKYKGECKEAKCDDEEFGIPNAHDVTEEEKSLPDQKDSKCRCNPGYHLLKDPIKWDHVNKKYDGHCSKRKGP